MNDETHSRRSTIDRANFKPTAWLMLAALTIAGMAGCLADDDGLDEPGSDVDVQGTGGWRNATDSNGHLTETAMDASERHEIEYEGSGQLGLGTSVTGSNFWVLGSEGDFVHDADFPSSYESGTLDLDWNGTLTLGGLVILVQDGDGENIHVFEANEPPFSVELDGNDARLAGAETLVVIPDQGTPATLHLEVEWSLEFSFQVAQSGMMIAEASG